ACARKMQALINPTTATTNSTIELILQIQARLGVPRSPSPIAATALHGTERLFGYTASLLRLANVLFDVAQDAADVIDREVACEGAKKAPHGTWRRGAWRKAGPCKTSGWASATIILRLRATRITAAKISC